MFEYKQARRFFLAIMLSSFCLLCGQVWFEVHVPGTDVFLFKEAGINLAQKGQFVASNLPHMPFGVEKTFAYYPPVYPFLFGVWSWLFGVGLPQSLSFNAFLTFTRTLLMGFLLLPMLPKSFFEKNTGGTRWAVGVLWVCLSLLTTDRDRPDELAMVFGFTLLLILQSSQREGLKLLGASVALALEGATSPACGVLFGLVALIWSFSWKNRSLKSTLIRLLTLGVGSLVSWSLIILPVVIKDLASGLRFSKQVGLSSFPYLKNIRHWSQWNLLIEQFSWNLRSFYGSGSQYVHLAAIVVILGIGCWRKNKNEKYFMGAGLVYILLVPFVWTLQPYYLWFSILLLMIGITKTLSEMPLAALRTTLGLLFIGVFPLLFWEMKCLYNTFWIPESEKRPAIAQAVMKEIEPQASLGVTHDQYFTFRDSRQVINVDYWAHELSKLDYLYLTDLPDSTRQNRKDRQILSHDIQQCFQLVKDFSSYQKLPNPQNRRYYVRGNGGKLFKNKCAKTQAINLGNPPAEKTNAEAAG